MATLYIILSVIAGLILLALIAAALMPKTYNIEKSIIIKRPADYVSDRIADLNHYAAWNPWQKTEPESKGSITGTPKVPGHKYAWDGKKIGAGHLTLRDLDDRHIHFDLVFLRPWQANANDNWLLEPWGNGETKVTWQNNGALPYPVARLISPMLRSQLNKQFEEGLKNLKELCER